MDPILEERKVDVERLCALYGVTRLEVFGSVLTDGFKPETSDIDFLVELEDAPPGVLSKRYFGLLHALEDLFDELEPVVGGVTNPPDCDFSNRNTCATCEGTCTTNFC